MIPICHDILGVVSGKLAEVQKTDHNLSSMYENAGDEADVESCPVGYYKKMMS